MATIVREIPAGMTSRATRLAVEQREAAPGALGNGGLIAVDPGIEGSIARHNRPLESGNRRYNRVRRDAPVRKHLLNHASSSEICLMRFTASLSCRFISISDWIGPLACSSAIGARPSQKKGWTQATSRTVGDWRVSGLF